MGLRVCIDARIPPESAGGVAQVVLGLAAGLASLSDGVEEYRFLASGAMAELLAPVVGRENLLTPRPGPPWSALRRGLSQTSAGIWAWKHAPYLGQVLHRLPVSDGAVEGAEIDVVHFCSQAAFLTKIPSIYHPHDLQHVHLPEFFSRSVRARREHQYGAFCRAAKMVAVASNWVRHDVIEHYVLSPEKVWVVPLAPPVETYPVPSSSDLARARVQYELPNRFVLYPAQTWPHKNHLRLLEAIAWLREAHGLSIPLVCTGHRNEFYATIRRRVRELRIEPLVHFVGFVSSLSLQSLYRLARATIVPTLFEAGSFPVAEAFHSGCAVACSNVTSLPEQAGEAALLFDPRNSKEIGEAIRRLWTDDVLRSQLIERGRRRIESLTWERSARMFRAHYRRLGGVALPEDDCATLASGVCSVAMLKTD